MIVLKVPSVKKKNILWNAQISYSNSKNASISHSWRLSGTI